MTTSGELIHRVRIEQRDPTLGALREQSKQWVPVVELRARCYPLRGREFFEASQQQSEITMRVRIRYRAGITDKMRLLWMGEGNNEPYDIAAPPIMLGGKKVWMDLMVKHGIRDGRG